MLDIALSTLSAHLRLMKNTGLIEDEKDGRWVIYRLSKKAYLNKLLESLEKELLMDATIENDRIMISHLTREVCASKLKQLIKKK